MQGIPFVFHPESFSNEDSLDYISDGEIHVLILLEEVEMTPPLNRILNRRTLLTGASAVTATAWIQQRHAAGAGQLSVSGDCSLEPALQHVFNFSTSNFNALPLHRMGSLEPGPDWVISQSPELGILLTPPGWRVINEVANTFDREGLPQWQSGQLPFPWWATTVVESPDASTGYIFIRGALDDIHITPAAGADLTRHLVMLPDVQPQSLCLAEQVDNLGDMTNEYWVSGDRYDHELLLSRGTSIVSSVSGSNLGPGSTFLIDAFVAPADRAEDLVLDVYLKILYQLLPKGGAGDPTPTPTP